MTAPRPSRRAFISGLASAGGALIVPRRAFALSPSVLGRFVTTYLTTGAHESRASNVELAASAIDGATLVRGAVFSFNAVVGERTAAYGYDRSIVLRNRMLAEGVGGGACQVASTLHAAALLAGLTVVYRAPHSRPSSYIRLGLDATVAYPTIDLKLVNARYDQVTLRAHMHRGSLVVSVEGDGTPRPHVSLTSEILETFPYGRRIERDDRVPDGEAHIRSYGIPGFRAVRKRIIASDGGEDRDERVDIYAPVPERLAISPTLDARRLDRSTREETPEGDIVPVLRRPDPGVERPPALVTSPPMRVALDNTAP